MKTASTIAGVILLASAAAFATTPNYNFGSLGSAANGVNDDEVILSLNSPINPANAPGDASLLYSDNNANTVIQYQLALNPAANQPFTVEFWANPTETDNDDVPLSNRTHDSVSRTGWAFFQRAGGWNFRMYNGNGSTAGIDITGGTAPLGSWSHVVAVWNGTSAQLYVNGSAFTTNVGAGGYKVNAAGVPMAIGAHDSAPGSQSPYFGLVDETAFYSGILTETQIQEHYAAAFDPTPGAYAAVVQGDGALVHYTNVPEPASAAMLLLGAATLAWRRRRA